MVHEPAQTDALAVVLAAGKGTRMKSAIPKALHQIAGLSMLGHVMRGASHGLNAKMAVVVGPDMEAVGQEAVAQCDACDVFIQTDRLGTANAALVAREAIVGAKGDVFVLFCDTPLLEPQTLQRMQQALDGGAQVVVLGFETDDPTGYGRLIMGDDGSLEAIREHNDASDGERQIHLCNSGVMAFRCPELVPLLEQIDNNNAKGEYYLTDVVALARRASLRTAVVTCDETQLLGINDRRQLATAERAYQDRRRVNAMLGGATLIAPETVWFSYDTVIGQDVVIEPNVFFGPGVQVGDGAFVRANCHIEGAQIGAGGRIGPYARLRPGAQLEANVHIGNFVEVKNVAVGAGAKANHLAYLGDGDVGEGANIGAGTIFCNYDGFRKHRTVVGNGAFVGSNSALVAPVTIGNGAFVGSGSVISSDVPDNALALERTKQETRENWAAKFRALMGKRRG